MSHVNCISYIGRYLGARRLLVDSTSLASRVLVPTVAGTVVANRRAPQEKSSLSLSSCALPSFLVESSTCQLANCTAY